MTLEFLGDRLGISKERVRQIENRALEKLKRALTERYPQASGAFVDARSRKVADFSDEIMREEKVLEAGSVSA